jgi:hypothetical protein
LREDSDAAAELNAPLLSLLMHICSDESETDNLCEPGTSPRKAELKKIKRGFRFFVPQEPKIWIVGKKTG